jgi:hypothetical protein
MGRMGEMVSLLRCFCVLIKGVAEGFIFIRPAEGPGRRVCWGPKLNSDGAKGLEGVVGGPLSGLGGRAGSDIDEILSEDAISDKVRGVKR